MRRITKSPQPNILQEYRRKIGASYAVIDKVVYDAVLLSLLNEQGWVCGYCQQQIKNISRASIEHFCEQSICNGQNGTEDLRLSYSNMMAVCPGDAGLYQLHCDAKKATFANTPRLPIQVSPWNHAHMAAIKYTSTGIVDSSFERHAAEINEVLNLNLKLLKEKRKDKYLAFFSVSKYKDRTKEKEKMRRLLQSDLQKNGNKFSNDFPGLSEWMIQKYCS